MRAPLDSTTRRTPLVAAGFLAGAVIGALPPVAHLPVRWQCSAEGGYWIREVRVCEFRRGQPARPAIAPDEPPPPSRPEDAR
jgi:hypothetical protein